MNFWKKNMQGIATQDFEINWHNFWTAILEKYRTGILEKTGRKKWRRGQENSDEYEIISKNTFLVNF